MVAEASRPLVVLSVYTVRHGPTDGHGPGPRAHRGEKPARQIPMLCGYSTVLK
jgi:hypothetical protein